MWHMIFRDEAMTSCVPPLEGSFVGSCQGVPFKRGLKGLTFHCKRQTLNPKS